MAAVAEEQGCCCGHGGKCSCSLVKKETQRQGTSPPHGPAVQKPRLETAKSDGSITVFTNGHHKPVHRKNHAAHECGIPYKMPMPKALTEHHASQAARRSVDSLPLHTSLPFSPAAFAVQSGAFSHSERRLSKSEHPSPKLNAVSSCEDGLSDSNLAAIDFSNMGSIQTCQSVDSAAGDSMFSHFDPMSGVADSSFDPWSAFPSADSMPNNNPFGAWPTTFENSSVTQPALTAASSGTQSEIDEIPAMDDLYGFPMPSIQEDTSTLTFDPAINDTNAANRRSLPPNFFGNVDFSLPNMTNEWQTPVGSVNGSEEGKSKSMQGEPSVSIPDLWSTPTMSSLSNPPQPASGNVSTPGRPQSHSIGPGSAPNEDLIRQLFPDIDMNNTMFGSSSNSPAIVEPSISKRMCGLPFSNPTSAPMDDTVGFTSQPWADGSLSVPNDDYVTPFEQDYSSTGFTASWPYQ